MLPGDGSTQNTNRISDDRRWFALGAVLVTMFFSALDQTVVSTAMPVIIGDLKGFSIYAWVFTAYMIASTVTVPIYGKLSDVYGRKPFYVIGLGLFMLGSVLSGQAHTMMQLIIFRAFQGIGGGAMLSMPRATIGDIFNPRERGRWMGVIAMTFGLASIVGPFLGGWITDHWGWRWIFYINLPVAAGALAAILYALPRVRVEKRVHVDWGGSVLLVAGLIPLLLGFTWAGSRYAWGSPQIIGLFAFSVAMLVFFGWAERRAVEPVIPIEFFRVRLFTTANLVGFLLTIGMFGTLMFLPVYVQGVLGMTAQNSGAVMTPMMLSVVVGSLVAGQVMTRTGRYKLLTILSAGVMAGGMFLMTRLGADSTWGMVIRDMLVTGVGIGGLMPTLNVAVQNAFPYEVMGVVNASQQFVRSLGGAIAAPILGTVLANTFASRLQPNLPAALKQAISGLPAAQQKVFLDPQSLINSQTQTAIRSQFAAFGAQAEKLYQGFIAAVHQALASGMTELFLIALCVALAALAVTFFLPEISLKHDEFYEPDAVRRAAAGERREGPRRAAEPTAASSGGGSGGEPSEGRPPRRPSGKRPWVLAGAAAVLGLALLGLGVHALLVRHDMARDLDTLKVAAQAIAQRQQSDVAALESELHDLKAGQSALSEALAVQMAAKTASVAPVAAVELLTTTVIGQGMIVPDHGAYRDGAIVSVQAIPAPGWHFAGWGADASSTKNPTRVTMSSMRSVTATFLRDSLRITSSAGPGGTINPTGAVTLDSGSDQAFFITPAAHHHVAKVIVDGTPVGAVARYAFTDVRGNHTISVTFASDETTLTVAATGEGTVAPDGGIYDYGTRVSLRAIPNTGWHFLGWSGDLSSSDNPAAVTMNAARRVVASFAPDTEMVIAQAGAGGTITPSGSVRLPYAGDVTFTIAPAAHSHIEDVLVDGRSVGATPAHTLRDVTASHTIDAVFARDEESLSTATSGGGTVTPEHGRYAYGTAVTLRAIPDPGWHFVRWSGDGHGTERSTSIMMTDERHVQAAFAVDTETISASAGANGTIDPSGSIAVTYGADQRFAIRPDPGYRVAGVEVDGRPIGAVTSYTLSEVTGNHAVHADFTPLGMATVTASAGAHGTIDPSGEISVQHGGVQTFSIAAQGGYHVADVVVDGRSVGPVATYTFRDVTQTHSIEATFGPGEMLAITASAGTGGSISPGVVWLVGHSGTATFTIQPEIGYHVTDVLVDGRSIGAVASYTFRGVSADHTISVRFAADTPH